MRLSNVRRTIGKIVEVTWLDASFRSSQENEELEKTKPIELLVKTTTIGKVLLVDKNAIVVSPHINEGHSDVYTIPFGMIKCIKIWGKIK